MENVHVLLVEDNEVNQYIVCTHFRKMAIGVTVANNGAEAIVLIQSKKFHIVLMDIQMPVMDGFEATRVIRSMEDAYYKAIPILAFSASSLIDSQEKAMKHGMVDFINKPFSTAEFQTKIHTYINQPTCT